jgi:transcriptional regulator with XRE-family HTH domain
VGKPNDLLKAARDKRGWTQAEVAEKIDCPNPVTVSRWEIGATVPSRYYLGKLCKLFDMDARELGFIQVDGKNELTQPDPLFLYNIPLSRPEELYGRRREKKTLIERTYYKASTSITGPRRIGKTWLVQYLRLVAPEELGSRFHIGYMDAMSSSCATIAGFTSEALSALGLAAEQALPGLDALALRLQQLREKKIVPVLCIDEFECIADHENFSVDFFGGLRAMTQTLDLVLVVVSKNPLHLVVGQNARGSGFFNVFERVALKPFTLSEAEEFIQRKSRLAGFTSQEREYLWKYGKEHEQDSAWLPLRLQLAGKLLLDDLDQARGNPNYGAIFEELFTTTYGE